MLQGASVILTVLASTVNSEDVMPCKRMPRLHQLRGIGRRLDRRIALPDDDAVAS